MAYRDIAAENRMLEQEKNFQELKEWLRSKDENQNLNDFVLAGIHIAGMEIELDKLKKQVEEYRKFFQQLDNFLPRRSSVHDIIG